MTRQHVVVVGDKPYGQGKKLVDRRDEKKLSRISHGDHYRPLLFDIGPQRELFRLSQKCVPCSDIELDTRK